MKKYIIGSFVALTVLLSAVSIPVAHAAALTQGQISAIISLLQVFGADQTTLSNVQAALGGTAGGGTPPPLNDNRTVISGSALNDGSTNTSGTNTGLCGVTDKDGNATPGSIQYYFTHPGVWCYRANAGRGYAQSYTFTTGAVGGPYDITVFDHPDGSGNGRIVTISKTEGDFSNQIVRGTVSPRLTHTLFYVGARPAGTQYAQLDPNTTYYLNVTNDGYPTSDYCEAGKPCSYGIAVYGYGGTGTTTDSGNTTCPPGQVVIGMTNSIPGVPICGPAPTSTPKIISTWSKTTLTGTSDSVTVTVSGLSHDNAAGCLSVIAHPTAAYVSPSTACTKASDYIYFKDNSRWVWNAANQTWTQTWTNQNMASVFVNGVKVQTHYRNMTTGEQKDNPVVSVSTVATTGGADLCAQQGLKNAAATASVAQYANLPTYHLGANEALVFPVTVGSVQGADNSFGEVGTVYESSEYAISLSKNKCDFSPEVEASGCLSMTGAYNSEGGLKWVSSAVTARVPTVCRPAPGQYWLSIRNADVDQAAYNGSPARAKLARPIVDYCGYLTQRDGQARCQFSAWPNFPGQPDATPFGSSSSSGGDTSSKYTCSNGTVVSSASQCPSSALIPMDPASTPGWGSGSGKWVYFQGAMQVSPQPPVCNSLVYSGGSCAPGSLCRTADGQNRYVCQ